MMPASDLPMRERIAEALYANDLAELQRHQAAARAVTRTTTTWAELNDRRRAAYYSRADAVLDLWADLPDTTVEAGAREAYEADRHLSPTLPEFVSPWDEAEPFVRAAYHSTCRTNPTAAIAAFKEGKA